MGMPPNSCELNLAHSINNDCGTSLSSSFLKSDRNPISRWSSMVSGGNTYQICSFLELLFHRVPRHALHIFIKEHQVFQGLQGYIQRWMQSEPCVSSVPTILFLLYTGIDVYLILSDVHSHFIICVTPIYSFITFCQCQYPSLVFWQSSSVEKTNTMPWLLYGIPVATTSTH